MSRGGRPRIGGKLWRLYIAEKRTCHLCGQEVTWHVTRSHPAGPSRDHIVPVLFGGDGPKRLAHSWCNHYRGHRYVDELDRSVFVRGLRDAVAKYERTHPHEMRAGIRW